MKLALCYHWNAPTVNSRWAHSLLCVRRPPDMELIPIRGMGHSEDRAVTVAFEEALRRGADWILHIDCDQTFPNGLLEWAERCIKRGWKAVTAAIPRRLPPHETMGWSAAGPNPTADKRYPCLPGTAVPPDISHAVDITHCATGCLLFDAKLLETIKRPWLENIVDPLTLAPVCRFDVVFTYRLATESGALLWLDPSLRVGHLAECEVRYGSLSFAPPGECG